MFALLLVIWLLSTPTIAARGTWMLRSEMEETVRKMRESFKRPLIADPPKNKIDREGLRNVTLKVIFHELPPYTRLVKDSNSVQISGYIGEIWKVLQTKLGFRSEYRITSFSRGKEILAAGLADIMLSPVVYEADNAVDFDIGGPLTSSVYSLYHRALDDHGSSSSYLWTWSRSLWISYIGVLMICTILLYFMTNIRRYSGLDTDVRKEETALTGRGDTTVRLSLGNCFLVILGAATQQDVQIRTKVCSLRVLLVVLLIFNHLMTTSYTSVLVSRLTVGNTQAYFTSLESIPDIKPLFLGVRMNSAAISIFQKNDSSKEFFPRWSSIINKGPCHPDPRTTEDVASNICKGQCVIFESDNIMSRLLEESYDCDMVRIRSNKASSQISILFKKHLLYGPLLRREIIKIKNAGILDILESRFLYGKGMFPRTKKYQEVTIGHVRALVMMYAGATALSCLLLALELTVGRRPKGKIIRRTKVMTY